jgi:hypothetical protein
MNHPEFFACQACLKIEGQPLAARTNSQTLSIVTDKAVYN